MDIKRIAFLFFLAGNLISEAYQVDIDDHAEHLTTTSVCRKYKVLLDTGSPLSYVSSDCKIICAVFLDDAGIHALETPLRGAEKVFIHPKYSDNLAENSVYDIVIGRDILFKNYFTVDFHRGIVSSNLPDYDLLSVPLLSIGEAPAISVADERGVSLDCIIDSGSPLGIYITRKNVFSYPDATLFPMRTLRRPTGQIQFSVFSERKFLLSENISFMATPHVICNPVITSGLGPSLVSIMNFRDEYDCVSIDIASSRVLFGRAKSNSTKDLALVKFRLVSDTNTFNASVLRNTGIHRNRYLVLVPGSNCSPCGFIDDKSWKILARRHDMTIIFLHCSSEIQNLVTGEGYYNSLGGSGKFLEDVISSFASEGDPEIYLYGISGGGNFVNDFIRYTSLNVVAFASESFSRWGRLPATFSGAGLLACGELDSSSVGQVVAFHSYALEIGKNFILVVTPNQGHIYNPNTANIVRKFFSNTALKIDDW